MSINAASFKILVGSFTDKNVLASGNALTIYQIGAIDYKLTTILDSVDLINEFYEEGGNSSNPCTSSLFGCTESLVINVDPECPNGTGGTGPQGPQGPSGSSGTNGKTTIITVLPAIPLDCGDPPTAAISPPVSNADGTQTQTLTLGIPVSCPGGDGGSTNVSVQSQGGTSFNVGSASAINFRSSANMSLGAASPTTSASTINIKATCTAVGYFKILSMRIQNNRFIYRGCPQKFMSIGAGNIDPNTSDLVDLNFVDEIDAIEIVNVAEDNFSTPIPLGVDIVASQGIATSLVYPSAVPASSVVLSTPLTVVLYKDTSNMFQDGTVGEIGQNGGNINKVWFINTKNPLNGTLLKGKIAQVELFDGANSGPKWRYILDFCSIDTNILAATGPTVNLSVFKGIPQVYAYNQYEIGNTGNSGYGYPVTFSSGTFSLTSSPGFIFNHVPLNQIVDIGIDESGSFYFKAPNTITGACV
jgi:hypothetical protein